MPTARHWTVRELVVQAAPFRSRSVCCNYQALYWRVPLTVLRFSHSEWSLTCWGVK
ncbi:hypothetical protein [Escherichia coli]|uniref:hypothetical protein n=1 Tax=Escherichia coli TaxID=562 RepID=UPI001E333CEA|nr:hypothetical protein [Escherichia coli]MCC4746035.1 hypothetical protein [Escherichia coli]